MNDVKDEAEISRIIAGGHEPVRESTSPQERIRSALTGRSVCPFCGQEGKDADARCLRCNIESTQASRQNARARIGPWHVLNPKHPGSRGMRFDLILSLIRSGKITSSNVVRGPTTHQLWRHAAKVRGLSREWGLCFACGESIERESHTCPGCQRSQEPPKNPNTLVEVESNVAASLVAPIQIELPGPPASLELGVDSSTNLQVESPAVPEPHVPSRHAAANQIDAVAAGLIRANPTPPRPSLPLPNTDILTAEDLASAFRLTVPSQQHFAKRRRRTGRRVAAIVLFALVSASVAVAVQPAWRGEAVRIYGAVESEVRNKIDGLRAPATQSPNPTPPKPAPLVLPEPAADETAAAPATQPSPGAPPYNPRADLATGVEMPAPSPWDELMSMEPKRADNATTAAENRARTLWVAAFEAERSGDFASAIKSYEEIKKLPKDVWPGGLEQRLGRAKQNLR